MNEQATFDARLAPAPGASRLWAATLREAFDEGTPAVWVADVAGEVAAFAVAERAPGSPVYASAPAVHVGELYVDPAHRRRGLARRLLDAVADAAERDGVAEVRFDVAWANAASRALVAAWGGRPLSVAYTRASRPAA